MAGMRRQDSTYRGWKLAVANDPGRRRAILGHGVRSKPAHYVVMARGYSADLVLEVLHRQIDEIEGELAAVEDQPG
jgi:hypothetical protein